MAKTTNRARLRLTEAQQRLLAELSRSGNAPARQIERARVLLRYAAGASISDIQRQIGVSRPTIYKCIDKALDSGIETALRDACRKPRKTEIMDAAKAWVVGLASTQPKEHGLAAELWTLRILARHIAQHAQDAGFPRLATAGKTTVWRILKSGLSHSGSPLCLAHGKKAVAAVHPAKTRYLHAQQPRHSPQSHAQAPL